MTPISIQCILLKSLLSQLVSLYEPHAKQVRYLKTFVGKMPKAL